MRLLLVLFCCTRLFKAASLPTEQNPTFGSEGEWQAWKLMHDKHYVDINEDQHRKAIWQANLKVNVKTSILGHYKNKGI